MKIRDIVQNILFFLLLAALLITAAGSLSYGFTSGELLYATTGALTIGAVITFAIKFVLKQYTNKER